MNEMNAALKTEAEDDVSRMKAAVGKLSEINVQGGDGKSRMMDIPVTMQVIIGKTQIAVSELLDLKPGQVILLDREMAEPVELAVNGKVVAHAQIVVCEGESPKLGVSITSIGSPG